MIKRGINMIAMLIKHTIEGNEYEFIERPNIWYIGKLLAEEQINNLRKFNNTVIAYKMLQQLGEKKILSEIEALVGFKCIIKVHDHDDGKAVIVWRKPQYTLDTKNDIDYFVLYITNYGDEPVEVKRYPKLVIDKLGYKKVVTQEDVKKWLKADGYKAVKFKEI